MTWSLFGQCLDVVLASFLIVRLIRLGLHRNYLALMVFVLFDGIQSLMYIPFRMYHPFDYRVFYLATGVLTWCTTIWMVYSILFAILQHLPGILRFSIWFLNVVFIGWIAISVLTMRPEWAAYALQGNIPLLAKLVLIFRMLNRAFSLAEILIIISVLLFVLRYPIQVPRNLAVFTAAISIFLCSQIVLFLSLTYLPDVRSYLGLASIPSIVLSLCLVYWILTVNSAGEEAQVVLGRGWQSVPEERLVHQLDALNAALLRSREQSKSNSY